MDKIKKFFKKISKKDKIKIRSIIILLKQKELFRLDIKKVKAKDYYRVRVGQYRIKFKYVDDRLKILGVGRKNDTFYKK
jgi:mRNA-degrading endonuclease RelE of RelBE toxin-antitoxin system